MRQRTRYIDKNTQTHTHTQTHRDRAAVREEGERELIARAESILSHPSAWYYTHTRTAKKSAALSPCQAYNTKGYPRAVIFSRGDRSLAQRCISWLRCQGERERAWAFHCLSESRVSMEKGDFDFSLKKVFRISDAFYVMNIHGKSSTSVSGSSQMNHCYTRKKPRLNNRNVFCTST